MKGGLALTIILALIVMGIVVAGLATGFLLTGKSRLRRGCGLIPKRKRQDKQDEHSTCSLCGHKQVCEEEKDESRS